MTVQRSTFTLTILHTDGITPAGMGLDALCYETSEGDMLGSLEFVRTEDVPDADAKGLMMDMGNDGSFFDDKETT